VHQVGVASFLVGSGADACSGEDDTVWWARL